MPSFETDVDRELRDDIRRSDAKLKYDRTWAWAEVYFDTDDLEEDFRGDDCGETETMAKGQKE